MKNINFKSIKGETRQGASSFVMVMFFTYAGFFVHPQMSYYICMMIGIFFFAELAMEPVVDLYAFPFHL